jgi:hypothetical protein
MSDLTKPAVLATIAGPWAVPLGGAALFSTDHTGPDERVLRLYAMGKQKQWDAESAIDWAAPVDPDNPLGMPDTFVWIAGSPLWERLGDRDRAILRRHTAGWSCSQNMHAEQFGLLGVAKILQTVPDVEAKLFAATQVIDEARHTETFTRLMDTKIGIRYPLTGSIRAIYESVLSDGRWDLTALAIQVLIENLALASFGLQRDLSKEPLVRALNTSIMQDEARHVAFGRILLRRVYRELSSAELRDREEFAVEACLALRDGFAATDLWQNLDYGAAECIRAARSSPSLREFRRRLFMRIVPALKDIGLFGPTVQEAMRKMGVLGFAGGPALGSPADDRAVTALDRREQADRAAEIDAIVRLADPEAER